MHRLIPCAAVALIACSLTTEPIERVEVTLTVAPREVQPGDSVHFVAKAFNATDERIQIGHECGPSFDVHVRRPDGGRVSVLRDLTRGGVFTCELAPHHFVDPGETETLRYSWPAPSRSGQYRALTGFRRGLELSHKSATVKFTVK